MTTDPVSNMIISLKNASNVSKSVVSVPFSNFKYAIAKCLKDNGYIAEVSKKTIKNNIAVLEITLAYNGANSKIKDLKRLSKPSKRTYLGVKNIHSVKNGYGMMILSTPKGILSDKQARKELVGGEALFMIW